jgi:hypothetical protein
VRALGRHIPILMYDVKKVRIISSGCIFNDTQGRLLIERPRRHSTKKGGTV